MEPYVFHNIWPTTSLAGKQVSDEDTVLAIVLRIILFIELLQLNGGTRHPKR